MSRHSLAPSKFPPNIASTAPATAALTEELEKLEQSITLTLQEIDSNFARAHRIITSSVLPCVERYARSSEGVWEGAKFWKGFFERSANVSLANYAEGALEEEDVTISGEEAESEVSGVTDTEGTTEGGSEIEGSSALEGSLVGSSMLGVEAGDEEGDITMTPGRTRRNRSGSSGKGSRSRSRGTGSEPDITSTPRPAKPTRTAHIASGSKKAGKAVEHIADYPSPYDNMRRELQGLPNTKHKSSAPITPGKRGPALPDMSMTTPSSSSPFPIPPPESAFRSASKRAQNKDTILHHAVLGKTYRVGFTPMAAEKTARAHFGGALADAGRKKATGHTPVSKWAHMMDETLSSSPEAPTPQLRAELFSSPVKSVVRPGFSVQTPGKKRAIEFQRERRKSGNASRKSAGGKEPEENEEEDGDDFETAITRGRSGFNSSRPGFTGRLILDDSDEEDALPEMSPLKTMQMDFDFGGGGRLLQTPAREASRRIVQDLLFEAGDHMPQEQEEYSPSIVMKRDNYVDDTF